MTSTSGEIAARPDVVGEACEMCPHALRAHDAISLRFCSATRAAAITRGCVCPSS
jgi:hypothetical protein